MVIEIYDKQYKVVRHLMSDREKELYTCRSSEDKQLYTVIRIKDKKITNKIIGFICEEKKKGTFADLVEHFVSGEDFHIVFTHVTGITLEDKLSQQCVLQERLELGKRLLEKMLLERMAEYFQCQCLKPENIYVTPSGEVEFKYVLDGVEQYEEYTTKQVVSYLYSILQLLFADELKKQVIAPMEQFLKRLKKSEVIDYMALYKEYNEVMHEVLDIPKEELATPKNWLFRLWDKVMAVRKKIKAVMLLLIFLGVFMYMVYTIWNATRPNESINHFENIGTMEILEKENSR